MLGFLLLFFCGGKQHIVENQSVTRRVWKQVQIGWRVAHKMLIIFGIVTAVIGKGAVSVSAVNISRLVENFGFPKNYNVRFDAVVVKSGGLPHKS